MADKTAFEIPETMRAFADNSVDQARKAFDDFMTATVKAVEKTEESARNVQSGAQDINRQALAYLEENVAASFDFAQKLVRARTLEEIGALQKDFLQRQMEQAASQGRSMTETIGRVASDVAPKTK